MKEKTVSLWSVKYGRKVVQRFMSVDPLAEDYMGWSPYNYTLNNPIRFVDPDGRSVDDIYVDTDGNYLGRDGSDDNTVRVVSTETWNAVGADGAQTGEGTDFLQDGANSTPLVGTSKASPGYQKGIGISDDTWGQIEAAGGERATPFLENNSDNSVFVKPEEAVGAGPGATADGTPQEVAAGQAVYGLVDGVKTEKYSNAVYKISNFNRAEVTQGGQVRTTEHASIKSGIAQGLQGGFQNMNRFGNWKPLMQVPIGKNKLRPFSPKFPSGSKL